MSDMTGTKATSLESHCIHKGYEYIRFDYMGHGQSSRRFIDGTIGLWHQNVLSVIDKLTDPKKPLILVGSSMGGWLMLLAALARNNRVNAIVGIASAPDFTEELIWNAMTSEQQHILTNKGVFNLESEYGDEPYPITLALIDDGRNHLLLERNINIDVPVRLIHGEKDLDVPTNISQRLHNKLTSTDKKLVLVENGDHRMSGEKELELLFELVDEVVKTTC